MLDVEWRKRMMMHFSFKTFSSLRLPAVVFSLSLENSCYSSVTKVTFDYVYVCVCGAGGKPDEKWVKNMFSAFDFPFHLFFYFGFPMSNNIVAFGGRMLINRNHFLYFFFLSFFLPFVEQWKSFQNSGEIVI